MQIELSVITFYHSGPISCRPVKKSGSTKKSILDKTQRDACFRNVSSSVSLLALMQQMQYSWASRALEESWAVNMGSKATGLFDPPHSLPPTMWDMTDLRAREG